MSKKLEIEGEEQVILYGKNKKWKCVVIKSFETRKESQKSEGLNHLFNSSLIIVKNSEIENILN